MLSFYTSDLFINLQKMYRHQDMRFWLLSTAATHSNGLYSCNVPVMSLLCIDVLVFSILNVYM